MGFHVVWIAAAEGDVDDAYYIEDIGETGTIGIGVFKRAAPIRC